MSKLQPAKLTLEDFKEQRSWISPLFSVLNSFTGDIVRAFSNGINVEDNLYQEIKEIKWRSSSGDFPLKFRPKFNVNPKGLFPIYLYNNTLGTYSILAPWIVWTYTNGDVVISDISGLTVGNTYTIRILVIYG